MYGMYSQGQNKLAKEAEAEMEKQRMEEAKNFSVNLGNKLDEQVKDDEMAQRGRAIRKEREKAEVERLRQEEAERRRIEAEEAERRRQERKRQETIETAKRRIASWEEDKQAAEDELANLKGLFTGKRRKELEAQIAKADDQLAALQAELKSLE